MNICNSVLQKEFLVECDSPVFEGGLYNKLWLVNRSSIGTVTAAQGICTALTIGTDKAYGVENRGNKPFTGSSNTMQNGDYGAKWDNVLSFIIAQPAHEQAKGLEELLDDIANGDFVAIVQRRDMVGNPYEVWGLSKGLKATGIVRTFYDDNVGDAWTVTLTEAAASAAPLQFMDDATTAETWITTNQASA